MIFFNVSLEYFASCNTYFCFFESDIKNRERAFIWFSSSNIFINLFKFLAEGKYLPRSILLIESVETIHQFNKFFLC